MIAVVDDDVEASEAIASLLQASGFSVVCFPEGESFLAAFDRLLPDAIVLDLSMPRVTGVEVLRELRRSGASDLPVVIVSGRPEGTELAEVRRLGATTLRKPVESTDLEAVLRGATAHPRAPRVARPESTDEPARPRAASRDAES